MQARSARCHGSRYRHADRYQPDIHQRTSRHGHVRQLVCSDGQLRSSFVSVSAQQAGSVQHRLTTHAAAGISTLTGASQRTSRHGHVRQLVCSDGQLRSSEHTGSFVSVSAASGSFTQHGHVRQLVMQPDGQLRSSELSAIGTGSFVSVSATSGSTFVSLYGSDGISFGQLNATSAAINSLSGATLTYTTAVIGTGTFSQINATAAGISTLTGASLTYTSVQAGTGTFVSLYAATGSFGALSIGTGSFVSVSAASGSFTQLNATGAAINSVSGTSLTYTTAVIGTGTFQPAQRHGSRYQHADRCQPDLHQRTSRHGHVRQLVCSDGQLRSSEHRHGQLCQRECSQWQLYTAERNQRSYQ